MGKRRSLYLHPQQRDRIHHLASGFLWRSELPTWLLILTIYAGWFTTLTFWQTFGLLPATLLLIWFTAWYMSLQHELIHGHPTRFAWLNQLFGTLPLAVWYPYGLYRDSHLAHHRHDSLTIPVDDPESYYFTEASWARFSPWQKRMIQARNTFCGRIVLAPLLDILQTLGITVAAFRQRQRRAMAMWLVHAVLLAALFTWMTHNGFSPVWFVLAVSYPALALTKVRSFYEHRAADDPLAVVTNLSDFIFSLIRAIGLILLGFGVLQLGLSLKSHDPSQRANGMLTVAGGIVITFTKEILSLITG